MQRGDVFGLSRVYDLQVENKTGGLNLSLPEYYSYGYFGGGFPNVCTIDRIDFSNETVTAPASSLTQAKQGVAAVSSSSYGYFGGGGTPGLVCTIDRLDFSNETVSNPPASLTQARRSLAATSSSSYGYFGGGYASPVDVCTIDRLDFSNETVSAPAPKLTQARRWISALSAKVSQVNKVSPTYTSWRESATFGYYGGGWNGSSTFSTIDRFDFYRETVTV